MNRMSPTGSKKKGKRKILTKDKHYYKHNKELIKQKAKQKYREKMKNREYIRNKQNLIK